MKALEDLKKAQAEVLAAFPNAHPRGGIEVMGSVEWHADDNAVSWWEGKDSEWFSEEIYGTCRWESECGEYTMFVLYDSFGGKFTPVFENKMKRNLCEECGEQPTEGKCCEGCSDG